MLYLILLSCTGVKESPQATPAHSFHQIHEVQESILTATSIADVGLVYSTGEDLWLYAAQENTTTQLATDSLPSGEVVFLDSMGDIDPKLLAYVYGKGLYVADWNTDLVWEAADSGFSSPLLPVLNPYATPFPLHLSEDDSGQGWLAAAGGLFQSADPSAGWTLEDVSESGSVNLLFMDVDHQGSQTAAVALLPLSILPEQYSGLFAGRIFTRETASSSWKEEGSDFPSDYLSSVALSEDQSLYVGTLDQGVLVQQDGEWIPLDGAPSDVVDLDWNRGGLSVASATRGIWRHQNQSWTQIGAEGVSALSGDYATGVNGTIWNLQEREGTPPPAAQTGRVFIALSFHTNFYHSYRGDSLDADGFGIDIEVIRNTLDWLDNHPSVHGNWDVDNAFTSDDWMVAHAPDIIERISQRVADGKDEIRLMSWNNGAMAASTEEEFSEAVQRAFESNRNTFGDVVSGVQPQECMFSPDHLAWYPDNEVDWITLFYAANGFTSIREDIELSGLELHNPVELTDPLSDASMTLVPVYHHADMLEHGGLMGWAKQLSANADEDQLLVIHFDADAESWEAFDLELERMAELDFVEWTTISEYLATHDTVGSVEIYGDVADGTGDGFQSWAEKDFNHRQFTNVITARTAADTARFLAGEDDTVRSLLEEALTPRLLALSTTNYGLAAPYLHEDRVTSAQAQVTEAIADANLALEAALLEYPLAVNTIQVINPRKSTGTALLEFDVTLAPETWNGSAGLQITDSTGSALPFYAALRSSSADGDLISIQMPLTVGAESIQDLSYSYDPSIGLEEPLIVEAASVAALQAPFLGCDATETTGILASSEQSSTATVEQWDIQTCGAAGTVARQLESWRGLDGVVIRVTAQIPTVADPEQLETVVLTPLLCDSGIAEISWRSYAGHTRSRPARRPVETWNGQAADGWVGMRCEDASTVYVAHRTLQRSSMAFAPVRNEGNEGILAPLGTIWGDAPWHFSRRTGGHGIGEFSTSTVGSQFRPAAPDWSGQTIEYTLLVSDSLNADQLDLFAHPPLVRVGENAP